MRLLLDECVDRRLANHLPGFEVRTVPEMGWATIRNGDLFRLAQAEFDAFITVDRNLSFQQNLPRFVIAVVILRARSNRLADLVPLAPVLIGLLESAPKGEVTWAGGLSKPA